MSRDEKLAMLREELSGHSLRRNFEREFDALIDRYSQVLERPRIAIQGIAGSFTDEAASKRFASFETVECDSFEQTFDAIERGTADFSLIPVENTIHGPVVETYDLLAERELFVLEEIRVRIIHCLVGKGREVYSHPQALEQCRTYIERHGLVPVPYYDTAGAVKEKAGDAAAIGSARAAIIYNAELTAYDIGPPQNATRFFLIGSESSRGVDKGAAIFALRAAREAGTLSHALGTFKSFGVNLTKIESRPIGNLTYRFIIEYEWNDEVPAALRALEKHCIIVRDLGRFNVRTVE